MPFPSVSSPPSSGSSVPDLSGVYRRLLSAPHVAASSVFNGTTELGVAPNGGAVALAAALGSGLVVLSFEPADFAVAGKTTKLRLTAEYFAGDNQIGTTFTVNLKPLTGLTGTTTQTRAVGAAVASVTLNNPAADGNPGRQTQEVNAPTAGLYALTAVAGAAFATNSELQGVIVVDVRNV